MKGYAGQILRVDLSSSKCQLEPVDSGVARKFIGGTGYAAHLLFTELAKGVSPLGPQNKIIFATSPITENRVPGGGSIMVCFKSPLTNAWCESRCGGNFGPDLRRTGIDFIIVEGVSEKPVYLEIDDDGVALKDASEIEGKDVYQKSDWLEASLSTKKRNVSSMCIGVGGENMVLFASIMSRDRAAGRGGGGAVMGAKKLLGIVVNTSGKVQMADAKGFSQCVRAVHKSIDKEFSAAFNEHGTFGDIPSNDEDGDLPTKNWRSNSWGKGAEIFDQFQENNLVKAKRCYTGCPIGCARIAHVEDGPYKTPVHEGTEYETMAAFTSFSLNENVDVAVLCSYLCNKLGVDTISTGAVIAFAMDCFDQGIITLKDTGGLELQWGDSAVLPILVEMISARDGFGDFLAQGVKRCSEKLGEKAKNLAVHVKGLEGPAHDPRSGKVLGLTYGTANRGMCHIHPLEGMAYDRGKMDWGFKKYGLRDPEEIHRWDEDGKGADTALLQDGLNLPDLLNCCKFMSYGGVEPDDWAAMLSAATGWNIGVKELLIVSERTLNLQRLFNMREGFRRDDDMLPKRVLCLPESGPYKDETRCVIHDYEKLLNAYYHARGWDIETGVPTKDKLKVLELKEYTT
jgi:aldehyde:ferredoxin oxidoreductase